MPRNAETERTRNAAGALLLRISPNFHR